MTISCLATDIDLKIIRLLFSLKSEMVNENKKKDRHVIKCEEAEKLTKPLLHSFQTSTWSSRRSHFGQLSMKLFQLKFSDLKNLRNLIFVTSFL